MFRGNGKLTEEDLKAPMREVRMALLEADVNFKVVKDFVAKVKERAVGEAIGEGLNPHQQIIKIVNEELIELLGGTQSKLTVAPKPPTVIMLVGLQGAGKTTTAGKLANYLKRKHKKSVAGCRRRLPSCCYYSATGFGRAAECAGIYFGRQGFSCRNCPKGHGKRHIAWHAIR